MGLQGGDLAGAIIGGILGVMLVVIILLFLLRFWMQGARCQSAARLDGKTVVITGANTGIGKETALDLSWRGFNTNLLSNF